MLTTVTLTLLEGLVTTLELFVLTLVFALPLGLIISFGSMSRFAPLRGFVKTVVWISAWQNVMPVGMVSWASKF